MKSRHTVYMTKELSEYLKRRKVKEEDGENLARRIHDTYWCLWDDFDVPPPLDRCGWEYLSPKQQGVMRMFVGEMKHIFTGGV